MGKLVVTEFVSVDGVFEDPGGAEDFEHGGWTFEYDRGDDGNKFKLDELMGADVTLLGRVTYEGFAAAWPSREGEFADKLNADPKYVVSNTLQRSGVAEHDGHLRRRRRRVEEAQGRDRRHDPRPRKRHARQHAARERPRRRAPADGLPDDPRPRQAPVPGRDRPAQVHLTETRTVGPDGVQVQVYERAG